MPVPRPVIDPQTNPAWVRTDEPLLWISGCGREVRASPSYAFDCRQRPDPPHAVLQLTLGGTGFYQSARGRSLLPAGTAFLDVIPGEFEYGYPPDATEPYEQVFVGATGPEAMALAKRTIDAFGNVLRFGPSNVVAPLMLDVVRRREDGSLGDRYAISGLLYQLYMTVFGALSATRVATEPRVTAALAAIGRRAVDPAFGVEDLAAELDCSREYLSRQFRASVGVSPSDYLAQHRLRLAARELRATGDKLDAIARRCGFSGANYLCRVFRKHAGVTPNVFRRRPWMVVP
ncbi:MAG TPA: AraC family transcriptional regulator [Tepidisphaeraceae bacterium]|nr:AraC family transcriptional regulator [Tepidisphaeraceae bacterium]